MEVFYCFLHKINRKQIRPDITTKEEEITMEECTQQKRKAKAAVAIIELPSLRQFLLVRRQKNTSDHWSGHYAFPGGHINASDSSPLAAAIRETKEEVGIILQKENLVAPLAIAPAGRSKAVPTLVQPFHFQLQEKPALTLQKEEIQTALWVDIDKFCEKNSHAMREMLPQQLPGKLFPSWPLEDYYLWGFTYELAATLFIEKLTIARIKLMQSK